MIRTVIADDEPMIVRGLTKLIDWESLGFEIIGSAYDGRETLRLVREERPGLLVSDINMPDCSGIDILKTIRSEQIGTQVIFVSGFHDFEYAHAAIKFGAVDYLLKPVSEKQLLAAISRIQNSESPLESSVGGEPELLMPPDFPASAAGYFTVINCRIGAGDNTEISASEADILRFSAKNHIQNELSKTNYLQVVEKDNHIAVILREDNHESAVRRARITAGSVKGIVSGKIREPVIVAIGKTVSGSAKLQDSYQSSLEVMSNSFYYPKDALLIHRESRPIRYSLDDLYSGQNGVIESLLKYDRKSLSGSLESYTTILKDVTFGNREATISHILGLVVTLKKRLEFIDVNLEPLELDAQHILADLHNYSLFTQVCSWLDEFITSVFRGLTDYHDRQIHPEIQKIKSYIEAHFRENVRLQDLSDLVYLHPNYLSSRFKKYTGKNFKDYLTEIRMSEAEKLINISDMRIYEIAESVGFTDYRYFSEVFKRTFGMTPREYRKNKSAPH